MHVVRRCRKIAPQRAASPFSFRKVWVFATVLRRVCTLGRLERRLVWVFLHVVRRCRKIAPQRTASPFSFRKVRFKAMEESLRKSKAIRGKRWAIVKAVGHRLVWVCWVRMRAVGDNVIGQGLGTCGSSGGSVALLASFIAPSRNWILGTPRALRQAQGRGIPVACRTLNGISRGCFIPLRDVPPY